MVRLSTKEDVVYLKQIWKSVFGDEEWLIDLYYENVFCDQDTIVWETKGKPVAVLHMIPDIKGEGVYFYALATLTKYRKQGVMTNLIKFALDIVKKREFTYAFLIPDNEKLFHYYENNGFVRKQWIENIEIENDFFEMNLELEKCEYAEMIKLTSMHWKYSNVNVEFNTDIVGFVLKEELSDENVEFYKLFSDEKHQGYVIIKFGRQKNVILHYGFNKPIFKENEQFLAKYTEIMSYKLVDDFRLTNRNGFIPF